MRQWVDKRPGGWIERWRDPLMDEVGERKPARPSGFWVRSQPGHGGRHRAGKRGGIVRGGLTRLAHGKVTRTCRAVSELLASPPA